MANPNIAAVATIKGENALIDLTTTNATSIIDNAAASGKVYKVNSLVVSNTNATTVYDVDVDIYSEDSLGGTAYSIVKALSIPAKSSVIIVDRNSGFYLKEDQSVGATASTANELMVTASWEEIEQ